MNCFSGFAESIASMFANFSNDVLIWVLSDSVTLFHKIQTDYDYSEAKNSSLREPPVIAGTDL